MARARATARPTTPAPTTTASSFSTEQESLKQEGGDPGGCGNRGHRPRGAVKGGAQPGAHDGPGGKADRPDQRGCGARDTGKRRQRGGGGVGHDERGAEQKRAVGQYDGEPMRDPEPG